MKIETKDIIDKYKNKIGIVIGHGPSLNDYLEKLSYYKEKGCILLGCNNWNEFYSFCPPHYWFNANTVDTSINFKEIINKYDLTWVYADSVEKTSPEWVAENIKNDYLPYDQRHFNLKKCDIKTCVCKTRYEPKLTIQEELQNYTKYNKRYGTGSTVVLHSLAFAIMMGFSEIYCIGLDFNYRKGYAKNNSNRRVPNSDLNYFDENKYGGDILNDFEIIKNSADKVGTKIYNTNIKSSWGLIEYKGEIL